MLGELGGSHRNPLQGFRQELCQNSRFLAEIWQTPVEFHWLHKAVGSYCCFPPKEKGAREINLEEARRPARDFAEVEPRN